MTATISASWSPSVPHAVRADATPQPTPIPSILTRTFAAWSRARTLRSSSARADVLQDLPGDVDRVRVRPPGRGVLDGEEVTDDAGDGELVATVGGDVDPEADPCACRTMYGVLLGLAARDHSRVNPSSRRTGSGDSTHRSTQSAGMALRRAALGELRVDLGLDERGVGAVVPTASLIHSVSTRCNPTVWSGISSGQAGTGGDHSPDCSGAAYAEMRTTLTSVLVAQFLEPRPLVVGGRVPDREQPGVVAGQQPAHGLADGPGDTTGLVHDDEQSGGVDTLHGGLVVGWGGEPVRDGDPGAVLVDRRGSVSVSTSRGRSARFATRSDVGPQLPLDLPEPGGGRDGQRRPERVHTRTAIARHGRRCGSCRCRTRTAPRPACAHRSRRGRHAAWTTSSRRARPPRTRRGRPPTARTRCRTPTWTPGARRRCRAGRARP